MKTFEEWQRKYEEEQQIRCPYCHNVQSNDDLQYPVTYWAEDGSKDWECDTCGKTFFVREHVRRYYEVGTALDDLDHPILKDVSDVDVEESR